MRTVLASLSAAALLLALASGAVGVLCAPAEAFAQNSAVLGNALGNDAAKSGGNGKGNSVYNDAADPLGGKNVSGANGVNAANNANSSSSDSNSDSFNDASNASSTGDDLGLENAASGNPASPGNASDLGNASLRSGKASPANAFPANGASKANAVKTDSTGGASLGNVTTPPVPSDADPLLAPAGKTAGGSGSLPAASGEAPVADSEQDSYDTQVETKIRGRLSGDLQRYCLDYCNILALDIESRESFETANTDLGFEGTAGGSAGGRKFSAGGARAEVMVDTRFGATNIERLQKLFAKIVERYPLRVEIQWSLVTFPDSGGNARSESQVRADFAQSVRSQLERVVAEFCPRDCRVHSVDLNVARAGVDEVNNGNAYRYLFSRDGKGALYVRGVSAGVSVNSLIDSERKDRIRLLMTETLLPFGTVNLQTKEIPFPRSAEDLEKDSDMVRGDPWGIKRLGEALKVFREFANTKEIIRETSSTNSLSAEKSSENSKSSEALRSQLEKNSQNSSERSSERSESERAKELQASRESQNSNSTNSNSNSSSASESNGLFSRENLLIVGGILLAALIAGAFGLRYVVTGKRMQQVINEGVAGAGGGTMMGYAPAAMMMGDVSGGVAGAGAHLVGVAGGMGGLGGLAMSEEAKKNFQLGNLQGELVQIFVTQPKVARDVFGRMIREDGIESTSKLVVIFGEMMIFELLGDADLKKEIYTLAEYVHVNAPTVPVDEQLEILRALKLKMTAGKMRLMTSKTLDMFDFLKAKSARQIYDIVNDESARSQAIVLTQISTEKRRAVFELFEGQAKVDLLRELSNNDVVQREYLFNVAEALKRKAQSRPSFDGERVQGIDVLLDLLERAELEDQRSLMTDLDRNSPEIARMLRTRLITVETLAYLRDGLLLEIFLSMESHTMATFLAGTRENVRNLILSKAPPDVADNWVEGLEQIRSIDAEALRLADMQVIAKVRSFSNQGLVSLLDINLSLYPKAEFEGDDDSGTNATHAKRVFRISNPLVA